jgi:hypothetical protein
MQETKIKSGEKTILKHLESIFIQFTHNYHNQQSHRFCAKCTKIRDSIHQKENQLTKPTFSTKPS